MTPTLRVAIAHARRHRVQTVVVATVSLLACATGVLALNLRELTDSPYDRAFDAHAGAHLTLTFAGGTATDTQLAGTAHVPAVAGAAGPWPETGATLDVGSTTAPCAQPPPVTGPVPAGKGGPAGCGLRHADGRVVVGRPSPGGSVDVLDVVSGTWPSAPDEVAVRQLLADSLGIGPGDTITASSAPGSPRLRVTAVVAGVAQGVDAWTTPEAVSRLSRAGAPPDAVMEYRLHAASSAADIAAARSQITAAAPPHSIAGAVSWLDVKRSRDLTVEVMAPFLLAFSVLGIGAVALIVVNVVSGSVAAARRDIGVMKSIGFTPAGVAAVMAAATLLPVLAGAVAGVPIGVLVSQPLLARATEAFDLPYSFGVSVAAIAIVVSALLCAATLAAALPALTAARASAAEALSSGLAPRHGPTASLWRRIAALRLPRPLALGAADSVVRPARSAVTFVAIVVGVSGVVFATGLTASIARVRDASDGPLDAQLTGFVAPTGDPGTALPRLRSIPGVAHLAAATETDGALPGDSATVRVDAWHDDASWAGYPMVDGAWLSDRGQAVVPSQLVRSSGLATGDTLGVLVGSSTLRLRIAGVSFDPNDDRTIHIDARDLAGVADSNQARPALTRVDIGVTSGTDPHAVLAAADPLDGVRLEVRGENVDDTAFAIIESVLLGLTAIVAAVAALGVLNTVALSTRERQHHIAVLRAIGMEPRQVIAMVVTTTALLGLVAGAVAIPTGITLHRAILPAMADIANTAIPSSLYAVYGGAVLAALALTGVVIAALGALLPARWIARQPAAAVLRAE